MRHVVLILAMAGACGGRVEDSAAPASKVRAGESFSGSLSPRPTPEAFAVAEVDGDTIWDVDVARYAREHHLDARTALGELIELTVLAQEAARRGLADDPEVVEARQRARVRALIASDFGTRFDSHEDVPDEQLQAAWRRRSIFYYFNHAHYQQVRYVRLPVPAGSSEAVWAASKQLAEDLRSSLVDAAPGSKEALSDAVLAWRHEHPDVPVEISDFAATQGEDTDKKFSEIAFSIKEVGEISQPGRTQWGWDVIYLSSIIPERKSTFEQAKPELRAKLFESSQRGGFIQWADGLVRAHKVVVRQELVDQVTVDSIPGVAAEEP